MTNDTLDHIALDTTGGGGQPEWTLVAAGDFCASGRAAGGTGVDEAVERAVSPELRELVASAQLAVINLEGPIHTDAAAIRKSGPGLELDADAPAMLARLGFGVASLANNHIMDRGAAGLAATIAGCADAGLRTCGAGRDEARAMEPVEIEVAGGVRVAVIAFCEREFGIAGAASPGAAWIAHHRAIACVEAVAARADVVVVIAHGGVEEIPLPPVERQDQLRGFIDAGACMVIGHHPHVPQGWELYGGGIILHSLGNFLFDYPEGLRYPKTEWGLVVRARFRGTVLAGVDLIPIATAPGRAVDRLGDPDRTRRSLEYLHATSAILADRPRYEAYWQALALHLWRTRYRKWLQRSSGAMGPSGNIRAHMAGLVRGVARRLGAGRAEAEKGLPELGDRFMLLNLIRNESHRWSIQDALAVESGDVPDCRTPQIEAHVRELLAWTED